MTRIQSYWHWTFSFGFGFKKSSHVLDLRLQIVSARLMMLDRANCHYVCPSVRLSVTLVRNA